MEYMLHFYVYQLKYSDSLILPNNIQSLASIQGKFALKFIRRAICYAFDGSERFIVTSSTFGKIYSVTHNTTVTAKFYLNL